MWGFCVKSGYLAVVFFFFNDTATTEIYTLSLHDALPIYRRRRRWIGAAREAAACGEAARRLQLGARRGAAVRRSEEHTSELQSRQYLVCRLLLEKKKTNRSSPTRNVTVLGRTQTRADQRA